MKNQLNFLGLSLWMPEDAATDWNPSTQPNGLYRPGAIAAYTVLAGLPVGLVLYSINVLRRGDRRKGYLLMALSAGFGGLLLSRLGASEPTLFQQTYRFLTGLIALHLYALERPYFRRAIESGWRPARWWVPLCLLVPIFVLLQMV